jgi:hypothetical protein
MLTTSAMLVLVLQCSCTLHPTSLSHSKTSQPNDLITGSVLPLGRQSADDLLRITNASGVAARSRDQLHSNTFLLAEADLNTILPNSPPGESSLQGHPASIPLQPTYEKWDVLRQYPRYLPPVQPAVPAVKPQQTPQSHKEIQDAQP